MSFLKLEFRNWLNERSNSLFWVGPLMHDQAEGIATLAHKLKNKMAAAGNPADQFLWNQWKSFYGAVSGIDRMVQMGNESVVLDLFKKLKHYFMDICNYYRKTMHYRGSEEENSIIQHIDSAIEELNPSHQLQPQMNPQMQANY